MDLWSTHSGAYWPSSALQGISHSKFIARLFKSFICHYWCDESIDDFFQRRSQSTTLTRTDINNLCKLINSQRHSHSRINAFVLTAFAALPLVVVAASDFHFRKRWQVTDEQREEEEKTSVSCYNDITISCMQLTARAMRHTPRAAVSSRFVSFFAFLILPFRILI